MQAANVVLAALIGLIDLNPLLDLVLTPLAWLLTFWRGGN